MANNIDDAKRTISDLDVQAYEKELDGDNRAMDFFWNDKEFRVYKYLTLNEQLAFVKEAVGLCFDDDTAEYMPEMKKYGIDILTIAIYTDIDLPEGSEEKYYLVERTDLLPRIYDCIDMTQYEEITDAIEKKIEYAARSNVSAIQVQISTVTERLVDTLERMTSAFGDVTNDDVNSIVNAIKTSNITPDSIAEAYINKEKERVGGTATPERNGLVVMPSANETEGKE